MSTTPSLGTTRAELYRHSGRVPPSGLAMASAILIPAAIVLGIIYSIAVVYVPFIKLRGVITFVYGGALGGLTGLVCYQAKFRSHKAVILMTLFIAFISYYSSWGVYGTVLLTKIFGFLPGFAQAALNGFLPQNIIAHAQDIFAEGIWAMRAGKPVSGWAIAAVWVAEALIIFGTALAARMVYGNTPFCEDCNQWTEETKELANLPVSPQDPAWQEFASGNLDAVKRLQVVEDSPVYVELQLAACPSCTNSDFVSAVGVALSTDSDGNIQKNEEDIVRHLKISRAQRDEVQQFAIMMQEAVEAMGEDNHDPDDIRPAVESTPEDPV